MQHAGHSRPRSTARAAGAIVLALVLAAVLGGCIPIPLAPIVSTTKNPPAKSGSGASTVDTTPAMPGADQTAGAWKVTVMRATRAKKGPGGAKASSGREFLLVDVEFRNIKMADALVLDLGDVVLKNSAGKKIPLAGKAPGYNGSGMRAISPGYGGGTVFAYAIPAGSSGYVWTFSPKVDGKRRSLSWGVP